MVCFLFQCLICEDVLTLSLQTAVFSFSYSTEKGRLISEGLFASLLTHKKQLKTKNTIFEIPSVAIENKSDRLHGGTVSTPVPGQERLRAWTFLQNISLRHYCA